MSTLASEITYPDVREILDSSTYTQSERISKLKLLLSDERQLQRPATESSMTGDNGSNARYRHLELALEALGVDVTQPEDNQAATL